MTSISRPADSPAGGPAAARSRRRRRDRHGRGRRGVLLPPGVPMARSRSQQFDDLVLDAVDGLEAAGGPLTGLEFAVEDVPPPGGPGEEFSPDVVADHGVLLGALHRHRREAVLTVYRRPVEARAADAEERADLVFDVVVELVAEFLGRDVEDVDPR